MSTGSLAAWAQTLITLLTALVVIARWSRRVEEPPTDPTQLSRRASDLVSRGEFERRLSEHEQEHVRFRTELIQLRLESTDMHRNLTQRIDLVRDRLERT